MKYVLILFLVIHSVSYAQLLKKKQLGTYAGTIESYRMGIDDHVFKVEPAEIAVEITSDSLFQTIAGTRITGTYVPRESTKEYTIVEFKPAGQVILVEYRLYRKGKKLVRKGIYPQPDAELKKQ